MSCVLWPSSDSVSVNTLYEVKKTTHLIFNFREFSGTWFSISSLYPITNSKGTNCLQTACEICHVYFHFNLITRKFGSSDFVQISPACGKIYIRGALDNFSLIPGFFFFFTKVEIFTPLEVYTYAVTACVILLATST